DIAPFAEAARDTLRLLGLPASPQRKPSSLAASSAGTESPALPGIRVFLSYAEKDKETASEIAARLREGGVEVHDWLAPEQRDARFITRVEQGIREADVFLALLSPSFLKSAWCKREVDFALQRELSLRTSDSNAAFIRVLKVRDLQS